MKVKLSYAMCSIFIQGADMNCPLCKVLVKSGTRHTCSKQEPAKPARKKRVTDAR